MHKILMLLALLALASCGAKNQKSVLAPKAIEKSFSTQLNTSAKKSDISFSKELLVVQKTAMEKEFLLRAQLIEQLPVPSFNNLQSRVVAFRKKGEKLFLLEANNGHQITDELPKNLLLAEFKILKEDQDTYTIDFNQGMNKVLTLGGWNASDFDGQKYKPEKVFAKADITVSYIDSIVQENATTISLRQIVQARFVTPKSIVNKPLELKYYISSYKEDKSFSKKKSTKNFDRYGFFETNPLLEEGVQDVIYYTKFNPNKGITFAISSNTPAEYKEAVRDGILYWNKAFGKEVVKVIDAPKGMTAPNVNYNIVQWVNWNSAGFAYADAQMDPRNGEILNAQVFMTSVFGFSAKGRVRALLRKLKPAKDLHISASIDGSHKSKMCSLGHDSKYQKQLVKNLTALLDKDDATILKASQDYIREVIAHEIGHTLGFRHNFAASLAANFSSDVRDQKIKDYIDSEGDIDSSIMASSSVMEYQRFYESIASGALIKKGMVFDYDKKAVDILYNDKEFTNEEMPLYCTDSHATSLIYIDCQRFDIGQSFVKASLYETQDGINYMIENLLENFAIAKAPGFGRPAKSVASVALSPKSKARELMKFRSQLMSVVAKKVKILSVERKYPFITDFFKEELDKDYDEFVATEFKKNGGVQKIFAPMSDDVVDMLNQKVSGLLNGKYSQGINRRGEKFFFNQEEKDHIKVIMKKYFSLVQKEFNRLNLEVLSGNSLIGKALGVKFKNNKVGSQFAEFYIEQMRDALLQSSGIYHASTLKVKGKEQRVAVMLPSFKYSFKELKKIAAFMASAKIADIELAFDERKALKKEFKEFLKRALISNDIAKVDQAELDAKSKKWFDAMSSILKSL